MSALEFYSTVQNVRNFTGIEPGDLEGLDDEATLNAEIEGWLKDIKSLIDEYVQRDFAKEEEESRPEGGGDPTSPVPRAIHNAALRAARNMVAMAKFSRNTGTAQQGENDQPVMPQTTLSNDIRADLKLFRRTITDKRPSSIFASVMPGRTNKVLSNGTS